MDAMTIPDVWSGQDRALTVEDMENMPDDEFRYELDDGVLIVSPAPSTLHQLAVTRLAVILSAQGRSRSSSASSLRTSRAAAVIASTGITMGWPVPSSRWMKVMISVRASHGHHDADIKDIRCGDRPTVLAHRPGSTAAWAWT
jgi:hypothetical protein